MKTRFCEDKRQFYRFHQVQLQHVEQKLRDRNRAECHLRVSIERELAYPFSLIGMPLPLKSQA